MVFIKGYKPTKEHREKLSSSHKSQIAWNKGLKGYLRGRKITWKDKISSGKRNSLKSKLASQKVAKRMGKMNKGKPSARKGIKVSIITKQKIKESYKGWNDKEKSYLWKGGITPLRKRIRCSFKFRQWRSDVFTRDNFTCQKCGKRGIELHPYHLKTFSLILDENKIKSFEEAMKCEELWNINNGITLCIDCHHLTGTWGRQK